MALRHSSWQLMLQALKTAFGKIHYCPVHGFSVMLLALPINYLLTGAINQVKYNWDFRCRYEMDNKGTGAHSTLSISHSYFSHNFAQLARLSFRFSTLWLPKPFTLNEDSGVVQFPIKCLLCHQQLLARYNVTMLKKGQV